MAFFNINACHFRETITRKDDEIQFLENKIDELLKEAEELRKRNLEIEI